MIMAKTDPRIAVRFGALASWRAGEAVLAGGGVAVAGPAVWAVWPRAGLDGHPGGCACCVPRAAAARVLHGLFVAAMRGEVARFSGVLADLDAAGQAVLRGLLAEDVFLAARFVLEEADAG